MLKKISEKKTLEGFPFFRVPLGVLIPLFFLILSCGNPTTTKTYKVTLNHNYGSPAKITVVNVAEGNTISVPSAVSRPGYSLVSWNTKADKSGTLWNVATAKVTEEITLYAQWKEGQPHISGNPEPEAPTQENKVFVGWYTSKTFTDITKRVDFAKQPSGTFFIHPKFVETTGYTITPEGKLTHMPSSSTIEVPYNVNKIAVKNVDRGSRGLISILGNTQNLINTEATKLFLPSKNLKKIGDGAFSFFNNLRSITIPANVEDIGQKAFLANKSMTSVTFSAGLKTIGQYSFLKTRITAITIPATVTSIAFRAFSGLKANPSVDQEAFPSSLISVRVEALTPPAAADEIFYLAPDTLSIKVPPGKSAAYKVAAGWKNYASKISEYTE